MSFGLTPRFFGSVAKHPGDAGRNEDAYKWSPERSALALSDGATESFDSRLWARLLVRLFVLGPALSSARLELAITAFSRHHDPRAMSWSRKAAFDRGSFATLVGVVVAPERDEALVVAVGDSLAVLLDGARLVESFPYLDPQDFRRRPRLLSTRREHNAFLDRPEYAEAATARWRLDGLSEPRIVCMSDAIAEWFLRRAQADAEAGQVLLGLGEGDGLETLVAHERERGVMRVDDSTVLILE